MPTCIKCDSHFPNWKVIDGKLRGLHRRKYCLDCSPFGSHNTKQIHLTDQRRKRLDWLHAHQKKQRANKRLMLLEAKGSRCQICGYNRCMKALSFHHVSEDTKIFTLSNRLCQRKWQDVVAEASKCILLCHNCHTEVHDGFHVDRVAVLEKELAEQKELFVSRLMIVGSKNRSRKGTTDRCPNCSKDYVVKWVHQRYCSAKCSAEAQQRVVRPNKQELKQLLETFSYVQVGRIFNVSDNSVRKWLRSF